MSDTLSGLSIRRVSTADQVASLMRQRILRGEFKPGTSLREVVIAAAIGVSRNTLREALRILVQEGLVRHSVHRGITVTQLSPESVADIYRIRRLFEVLAVEKGTPTSEGLEPLATIVERLEAAAEKQDWPALVEADMQFHCAIVSLLASERLDGFFRNLLSELRIGLVAVDRESSDLRQMSGEHRKFYQLLKEGKRKECGRVLTSHLEEAERRVKAVMGSLAVPKAD
ncbi:MAG TPA: GntR family transcriptional regulator [Vicinamibacteria bacterium]|jgi:DNA-binding GntR family transcriptional regulator|nr:GntR family transcriptional regulator [Vicinamibacteria bacterium]